MRSSTGQVTRGRPRVRTLGLALAVAAVLVGGALAPAFSADYKQQKGKQDRDWRAHQTYQWAHHPAQRAYPPYQRAYPAYRYYAPPPVMYAPPPVVYAPLPSPGISLFFGFPIGHP
jgi:hypothetical protein